MIRFLVVILCVNPFFITNCFANINGIIKISIVEKLCKIRSLDALEEQGINLVKWSSETFNGDRTFNIEGKWVTNVGNYTVECELPYKSKESSLIMILTKT